MQPRGETEDVLLLLRDVSTIRERRQSIVDTVPSRPPFMHAVEPTPTMESSTEIEIELDLDPPVLPPLSPFGDAPTHILPATFDEELMTDQWRREDHELDDPDLVPRVAVRRPRREVPLLRRAVAIGGSCLIVLVMAVVLYTVVVWW